MQVVITSIKTALEIYTDNPHQVAGEEQYHGARLETYRAGRELLRYVLEHFYALSGGLPAMHRAEHGKPYFDQSPRFFNISHSGELLALSVADVEQGLDLEIAKKRRNLKALIEKTLTSGERRYLSALDEDDQINNFGLSWTLREALIKESGLGLVGLSGLNIDYDEALVQAEANSQGKVFSYFLPTLCPEIEGKLMPAGWLSFFVNQSLFNDNELPFTVYKLEQNRSFTALNSASFTKVFAVN